jgi:hypothetical protein
MATVTKKYKQAIAIYPDLNGKKPLEVYSKMADKGYDWNSFESKWEREGEKDIVPIINLNIKVQNELADDAIELIRSALEEYGLEVIKESRPYPSKERDAKDKLVNSKTHSNAYIQILFPDAFGASSEDSDDEEIIDEE